MSGLWDSVRECFMREAESCIIPKTVTWAYFPHHGFSQNAGKKKQTSNIRYNLQI